MAERVFPACRRSPLFLSFPFFFLVSLFFFLFYLPFVPLQVNGDTSVYRFPVRLVYWLFIAVQIYRRSFGTNRNAPGQPEDPIFLAMPVISAPSSRVHLVKTERDKETKRERESRDQLSGRRQVSLFLSSLFLEFKMSYSSFSSFTNEWKNRLVSQKVWIPLRSGKSVGRGFARMGKMEGKVCWSNGYWWHRS